MRMTEDYPNMAIPGTARDMTDAPTARRRAQEQSV